MASNGSVGYRVFRCSGCGHVDYVTEESELLCTFCQKPLKRKDTILADTVEGAENEVRDLVYQNRKQQSSSRSGLGVRRRIISMVDALLDMNRGRPVRLSDVYQECEAAGISKTKTQRFLDIMKEDGVVIIEGGMLFLEDGGEGW